MEMIDHLQEIINAEIGILNLQSLFEMLPYFAASGHRLYLKSVHLYLQKMRELPRKHPEVYQHFKEGLHVIRRSAHCWSGLSPDLVIEQCLMSSVKMTGGLTRGRDSLKAPFVCHVHVGLCRNQQVDAATNECRVQHQ